jgi:hypothetical protein
MPSIVVVHSIAPGQSELYEDFVAKRKLAFIRSLPGVQRYEVFRRIRKLEPEFPEMELSYDIVATLEIDDLDTLQAARATPEYDAFRNEYVHLLQPRPVVYEARKMESEAALSREEFWAGRGG